MGFFAGELAAILSAHQTHPQGTPWAILSRMGVHPQQIDRLKRATEDLGHIASLQNDYLLKLRHELDLSPVEWARLQAAIEADVFFRLLLYHDYSLEEAANDANAVFSAVLKDRLATGGKTDNVYISDEIEEQERGPFMRPRRTRGKKIDHVDL